MRRDFVVCSPVLKLAAPEPDAAQRWHTVRSNAL